MPFLRTPEYIHTCYSSLSATGMLWRAYNLGRQQVASSSYPCSERLLKNLHSSAVALFQQSLSDHSKSAAASITLRSSAGLYKKPTGLRSSTSTATDDCRQAQPQSSGEDLPDVVTAKLEAATTVSQTIRSITTQGETSALRQSRTFASATQAAIPLEETSTSTPAGNGQIERVPLNSSATGRKQTYQQPQNQPADPWTPTQQLVKRNFLPRRMGFMMQVLEREQEELARKQKKLPDFGPGDVLELKLAVPENKGRPATFKGICIARRNRGVRTSFRLRNHMGNVGAIERSFPLYSPTIQSISVLDRRRVRRAKLYYLRDRNPKEYRVS